MAILSSFDHPAVRTAGGTVAGYLLLLGVMFLGLFVVPFVLFSLF